MRYKQKVKKPQPPPARLLSPTQRKIAYLVKCQHDIPLLTDLSTQQWSDYTPLFPSTVSQKNVIASDIVIATIASGKLTLSPTPVPIDQFQAWLCYNIYTPANAIILTRCRGFVIYTRPIDSYNRACLFLTKAMSVEALSQLDTAINQQGSLVGEITDTTEKQYKRYANIRNRAINNTEEHEMKLALELALIHGMKLWEKLSQ